MLASRSFFARSVTRFDVTGRRVARQPAPQDWQNRAINNTQHSLINIASKRLYSLFAPNTPSRSVTHSISRKLASNLLQQRRWPAGRSASFVSRVSRFYSTETEPVQKKPLTTAQKLKRFAKKYGRVGLYTYLAVSAVDLTVFYFLISAGVDVENVLIWIGLEQTHSAATTASTFAIAYAVHKLFMPIRIALTASILPFIVKRLNIQVPEVKDDDDDDDEPKKTQKQ
eukprot:TRINITY_DN6989_c0_g1_i1.p1 TRINITY_DN6989_c0_g1~~TRINITY_DN6989_c0_g1_i1.p1  ORF type:complete len:227 (-),score=40.90 TRINITY_DN6989_c0_g1_i1:116-796(-)